MSNFASRRRTSRRALVLAASAAICLGPIEARATAPKAVGMGGEARPVGPGEYVVKPGDTGTKISKAVGVSVAELEAINPGLDWRRLRVGQTIKTK